MDKNTLDKLSDNRLLLLMKEDNLLAFTQIYNRYWKRLFVYTYNILKDEGYVEDTLQEVFITIWTKRGEIQIQNLKGYLFNAVRNKAISKIRKEKLSFAEESIISNLSIPNTIELALEREDLEKTIERALNDLPRRCRAIFYMSRYEEYSITQIANHFKISHRTVENQLHRALKHLRNIVHTSVSLTFLFLHFSLIIYCLLVII
ncbi:RNA polymerase sigma-70 factor [Zobellia galactanivorans]|nr:RNA polymerase sigma-70 factor [Zobellia galactanivorans]